MTPRLLGLASILVIAVFLPGTGFAQPPDPVPLPGPPLGGVSAPIYQGNRVEVGVSAGPAFGPGYFCTGWPYGPRVAPPWGYYGLSGGPFVTYPWGFPGYAARSGPFWTNGLSLYGPPVPVYGPIPGVFGNNDLVQQWRAVPSPGMPFGWIGLYAASPRPRPLTVSVWPTVESVGRVSAAGKPTPVADPKMPGGSLILSVKLPQPAAELFVDGVKTMQTGTDRIFESPPLEAGKAFKYELTARWMEAGAIREVKKAVTGTPGEVVRVDFTTP